jgi:hypothetical protein
LAVLALVKLATLFRLPTIFGHNILLSASLKFIFSNVYARHHTEFVDALLVLKTRKKCSGLAKF